MQRKLPSCRRHATLGTEDSPTMKMPDIRASMRHRMRRRPLTKPHQHLGCSPNENSSSTPRRLRAQGPPPPQGRTPPLEDQSRPAGPRLGPTRAHAHRPAPAASQPCATAPPWPRGSAFPRRTPPSAPNLDAISRRRPHPRPGEPRKRKKSAPPPPSLRARAALPAPSPVAAKRVKVAGSCSGGGLGFPPSRQRRGH